MSQHHCVTRHGESRVQVTIGYDRPLDFVFMTILKLDSAEDDEDEYLYSNLNDKNALTSCTEVNYYRRILTDFGIVVPTSMFDETMRDQRDRVGNRVVDHTRR